MRIIAALLLIVCLSGCDFSGRDRTVPVNQIVPELEVPARPKLALMDATDLAAYKALPESARAKLEGNDKALKVWAEQLNVTIMEYNGYAKLSNKSARAWMASGFTPQAVTVPVEETKP